MTTLLESIIDSPVGEGPRHVHWTCDEFREFLGNPRFAGRKFILMDGEIIEMSIANPPHDACIALILHLLQSIYNNGSYVRVQSGLPLGFDTDPIPDLAVVKGKPRDHVKEHPTTAQLIVEVAESSLAFDKRTKAELYAAAAITEYWVVDVINRELHVYRQPVKDKKASRGYRYSKIQTLPDTGTVTIEGQTLNVSDMLP